MVALQCQAVSNSSPTPSTCGSKSTTSCTSDGSNTGTGAESIGDGAGCSSVTTGLSSGVYKPFAAAWIVSLLISGNLDFLTDHFLVEISTFQHF